MIKKLVHFSDLHIRLFKDHELYRGILNDMLEQFREIKPCRIVFTGDLLHSKNQLTPEAIEMSSWVLTECSKIAKIILIPGNHDANLRNDERLDSITPIVNNLNNQQFVNNSPYISSDNNGHLIAGTYSYLITYYTTYDETNYIKLGPINVNDNSVVNFTNIPISKNPDVIGRYIYRIDATNRNFKKKWTK
jgi:predicted MPP superfamily phosphohydrolase